MADKTVTVKASGGDYTTLQAAITGEAAANSDLTAAGMNGILNISIEGTWGSADTTAVDITGFTTDATHYINIYTTGSARHAGKWSATAYRNVTSNGNVYGIVVQEDYVRIDGLQVQNSAANAEGRGIRVTNGATSAVYITNCIIVGNPTATADGTWGKGIGLDGTGNVYVWNTAIYGFDSAIDIGGVGNDYIYNCVLVNCNRGVYRRAGVVQCTNCYSGGNTTEDYYGTTSTTYTTCASSDATARSGVTASIAYSTSSGAYFTSVTEDSEDFHIGSSSVLINVGTDLSATFTTDIDGTTRPTGANTWDLGIDEYVAAGGLSIPVAMAHYRRMREN